MNTLTLFLYLLFRPNNRTKLLKKKAQQSNELPRLETSLPLKENFVIGFP